MPSGLDPKVVEVYQGVGKVMSRYTAGKVGRPCPCPCSSAAAVACLWLSVVGPRESRLPWAGRTALAAPGSRHWRAPLRAGCFTHLMRASQPCTRACCAGDE